MIVYMLADDTMPEPGRHQMINVRKLSDKDMSSFSSAVDSLSMFNVAFSLLEICEENFCSLEDYYEALGLFRGGNQLDFHKITIKWNTLTLNYLSSCRSFNDHLETTLDRSDDPVISTYEKFKKHTAFHYDNRFSYRFLWALRNYYQHCGLPSCDWEFSEIKDGPKKGRSLVDIVYLRDGLLKEFDWKKLKTEIENQPQRIDVMSLFREFHSSIVDIALFTCRLLIKKVHKQYDYLSILMNEVISQNSLSPSPIILKFEDDGVSKPKFIGIVHFPLRIMTNIRSIDNSTGISK